MIRGIGDVVTGAALVFGAICLILSVRQYAHFWRSEYVKLHAELCAEKVAHAAAKALWEAQRKDFLQQVHAVIMPLGAKGFTERMDALTKIGDITPRHVDDSKDQLVAWLESKNSQKSQESQEKKCL